MLPKKLKNFAVFADGVSWMGEVSEIMLPKLGRRFEEWQGAGMSGPVKVDLGQQGLETEITLGGLVDQALKQYAHTKVDGVLLRFAGAYQSDSVGTTNAAEVIMRGRYEEIDMGSAKAGDNTEHKLKMSLSYYKLSINSLPVIEIDLVNMIEKINGVDNLAAQRLAIGLA